MPTRCMMRSATHHGALNLATQLLFHHVVQLLGCETTPQHHKRCYKNGARLRETCSMFISISMIMVLPWLSALSRRNSMPFETLAEPKAKPIRNTSRNNERPPPNHRLLGIPHWTRPPLHLSGAIHEQVRTPQEHSHRTSVASHLGQPRLLPVMRRSQETDWICRLRTVRLNLRLSKQSYNPHIELQRYVML